MQYSKFGNVIRNIQNKLSNRALKSDLKLTIIVLYVAVEGRVYLGAICSIMVDHLLIMKE